MDEEYPITIDDIIRAYYEYEGQSYGKHAPNVIRMHPATHQHLGLTVGLHYHTVQFDPPYVERIYGMVVVKDASVPKGQVRIGYDTEVWHYNAEK